MFPPTLGLTGGVRVGRWTKPDIGHGLVGHGEGMGGGWGRRFGLRGLGGRGRLLLAAQVLLQLQLEALLLDLHLQLLLPGR